MNVSDNKIPVIFEFDEISLLQNRRQMNKLETTRNIEFFNKFHLPAISLPCIMSQDLVDLYQFQTFYSTPVIKAKVQIPILLVYALKYHFDFNYENDEHLIILNKTKDGKVQKFSILRNYGCDIHVKFFDMKIIITFKNLDGNIFQLIESYLSIAIPKIPAFIYKIKKRNTFLKNRIMIKMLNNSPQYLIKEDKIKYCVN